MWFFQRHSSFIGIFSIQEDNLKGNWLVDVGSLADHPNLKKNPNATVSTIYALTSLASTVTQIIIDNGVSKSDFSELDLSRFLQLKSLTLGDHCFSYVNEVKVIGLSELENVEIGMNSFTKYKNTWYDIRPDPNRHFYVKNCPKLKSLKMGCFSFSDYSVIEIENVVALEVIEMGELNEECFNFHYASLELKSILIQNKWWLDLPSLKSLIFGRYAFAKCYRAVFESDWLWCEWLTRLAWIDFHSNGYGCIRVQGWCFNHTDTAKLFQIYELTD